MTSNQDIIDVYRETFEYLRVYLESAQKELEAGNAPQVRTLLMALHGRVVVHARELDLEGAHFSPESIHPYSSPPLALLNTSNSRDLLEALSLARGFARNVAVERGLTDDEGEPNDPLSALLSTLWLGVAQEVLGATSPLEN